MIISSIKLSLDGCASGLNNKNISSADIFLNFNHGFAVAETADDGFAKG